MLFYNKCSLLSPDIVLSQKLIYFALLGPDCMSFISNASCWPCRGSFLLSFFNGICKFQANNKLFAL